ncbi:AAC(3) family N-acetyltransferase [bacterium]|nr:AAC(3) family N-acetyltransferase [bacterium]
MEISERVKKVVRKTFNLEHKKIENTWTSADIPEWDSMGHLELIMAIEKEFDIKFEIEEMFKIHNLNDFNNILKMKKRLIQPLYELDNKKIYYSDFTCTLRDIGVNKGDTIFVHSDISAFGKLCISDRSFILKSLIYSLKESVSNNGTIIMPTFTYNFCKGEIYDVRNTKSDVGVLTEYFRVQPEVSRTIHPIFSVAIWGKYKSHLLDISKDSFDENSIFGKLHQMNGKIIFLGAPFQSCTYVHYVEQMHGVPYRYIKTFKGKIKESSIIYEDEYDYFVRYLDKTIITDLSKLERHMLTKGLMKEIKLGAGRVLMVNSDVLLKEGCKLLDKNIRFFLKENPK